jgi:type I restriction enzyme M protein
LVRTRSLYALGSPVLSRTQVNKDRCKILDPACGSGGMFVQSAHFIERTHANPTEQVTFYGMEKNQTTLRLALMNLAVHGLEGKINKAISYYEDPHELVGQADFVMANPPFNVDEVDADKVKNDPRLPFGLPGVNNKGKVSNGNYLWISYFYSYLDEQGRAGFVMSSQASSAGRDEATVRRKLVERGAVDAMMAIRSNFFYTRSVPCELWFLDRAKPEPRRDQVLMIDARNVYRQVTRKIYDFSPEQLANLSSIVWLYRGETGRFVALAESYLDRCIRAGQEAGEYLDEFTAAATACDDLLRPVMEGQERSVEQGEAWDAWQTALHQYGAARSTFVDAVAASETAWMAAPRDNAGLHQAAEQLAAMVEVVKTLLHDVDSVSKAAARLADAVAGELDGKQNGGLTNREVNNARKRLDIVRQDAANHLKDEVRYFYRQARWLQERFPDAELRDVPGLCKRVDLAEIEANDWSLTPGRYVGVAPEVEAEDFDFEEAIEAIHSELDLLNSNAAELAEQITSNLKELIT